MSYDQAPIYLQHNLLMNSSYCRIINRDELEALEINHPLFSAAILKQGAQLISYKPKNDRDWIWLSNNAEYKLGKSVRGGIPICWPWFGNILDNPESIQLMATRHDVPAHGFVRTRLWELNSIQETDESIAIEFLLTIESSDIWKGSALLKLYIEMSEQSLRLQLTTNTNDKPIVISQALHSYFPTSDIQKTRISGFENCDYYDALDNWQQKKQSTAVEFNSEVDRVYLGKTIQTLTTPERTYTLESNSASTVIWNPWIAKSKKLSQFDDNAWQSMFCVETANAKDDFIELPADSSHSLSMYLTAEKNL